MVIHITKKLAEKLQLSPKEVTATDGLLSWRAHYVQEHGYRFVVFMNDASRFTIVINEAKAARIKRLPELFITTLRKTLLSLCVNPEVIECYVTELGKVSYSKNTDRKKTAQLNKNTDTVWWGLREKTDDVELSLYTSGIYCNLTNPDDLVMPKEVMLKLLARYGLPVLKCRAFDLTVRLDLDGKDAIRMLRIPAELSFERFHLLLQTAFGWQNCHMYSFSLFREWSDDYYPIPDVELVIDVDRYEANPNAKCLVGIKLSDYVPEYSKILYTYDFGDDWKHYIEINGIIEDCTEPLPTLLSGEGDAPPEDVGGPGGFAEFLEIIADPAHSEYDNMIGWAKSLFWKPFVFNVVAKRISNNYGINEIATEESAGLLGESIPTNVLHKESAYYRILDYMINYTDSWGSVIGSVPFDVCDNCGNPATVCIDDNNAHTIGNLCPDCYNRAMAELTGSSVPVIIPKQISVRGKNGKEYEFKLEFYTFINGKLLTATEMGKLKRRAEVHGELWEDFDTMLETLMNRIKKALSVKYMGKDGHIAGDKAVGYIDYNHISGDCDIVIDGKPYTWAELGKNVSMREGWKIKIEFACSGEELD